MIFDGFRLDSVYIDVLVGTFVFGSFCFAIKDLKLLIWRLSVLV